MLKLLSCIALLFVLTACSREDVISGTGATLGIAVQTKEGVAGAANDFRIRAKINDLWFRYDIKTFARLRPTINDGQALITGVVDTPEQRLEAVRLVWQVDGVRSVINEIRIGAGQDWDDKMRDGWIETRLKMDLALDTRVYAINYSVVSLDGTVYLTGFARDIGELTEAIEVARTIPHVKEVVSYIRVEAPAHDPR